MLLANQHRLEIGARVRPQYSSRTYTIVGEIYWGFDADEYADAADLKRKPHRVLTVVDDNGLLNDYSEDELERA